MIDVSNMGAEKGHLFTAWLHCSTVSLSFTGAGFAGILRRSRPLYVSDSHRAAVGVDQKAFLTAN